MTAAIPLRTGPLHAAGYESQCSGLRWLCADGHECRPGEIVAFCNIGVVPQGRGPRSTDPFRHETYDFQVAFAPRVRGRLRRGPASSRGGFLDQMSQFQRWSPDFAIGHLEAPVGADAASTELRLLLGCGRRVTNLAEVRVGFLTGWHERVRAWWSDGDGTPGTLLSLGICELGGVIRGERFAFLDLFEATRGPAQVALVPDEALVPCARIVLEQWHRTPEQAQEIAVDMTRALANGADAASPADWLFAGALLSALGRSPLAERNDLLLRGGLTRDAGPDAVVLSLHAETGAMLRHRRLGYMLKCHRFRIDEVGPAVRAWLHANFEPVVRTPDEIREDYVALIDAVRVRSGMKFLIVNCMSTAGREDVCSYAAFDLPLRATLATIRSKELNLMLHDLARERGALIVDADAIAADIGAGAHLPDGLHASGLMQAETRAEILRLLRASGVPGFAPAGVR